MIMDLEHNFDEADGCFFMSFQDFFDNFTGIQICHIAPEVGSDWHVCQAGGDFKLSRADSHTAAVETAYLLRDVVPGSSLHITLSQEDPKLCRGP